MRLIPSVFLSILLGFLGICIFVALMLVLPLWLVLLLGYMLSRQWKKTQSWFREKTLCVHTVGQAQWTEAGVQREFHVGPQTLITPFLIILQCQSLLSRKTTFKWIACDSCTPQDFRMLTLKLKQILSKCG